MLATLGTLVGGVKRIGAEKKRRLTSKEQRWPFASL